MSARRALLDLLACALARTPLLVADGLAWLLAWLWWTVLPIRRDVARENIAAALPGLPAREQARVLRRSLRGLALGYVELLRYLRDPDGCRDMLRTEGLEQVHERLRRGQPCLVLQGHFGSWDLVLLAMGQGRGVALSCIVKPPADPWAAALVERARRGRDIELIPPRGAVERACAALEEGRIVLFTMDQRFNEGAAIPFLGRPALTPTGLAAVARRTRLPVHQVWQWREGRGRHVMRVEPAFEIAWSDDAEADLLRATALFNEALGARVREHPHNWFWLHRRWKR